MISVRPARRDGSFAEVTVPPGRRAMYVANSPSQRRLQWSDESGSIPTCFAYFRRFLDRTCRIATVHGWQTGFKGDMGDGRSAASIGNPGCGGRDLC